MSDLTTSSTYAEICSQPRLWCELATILRERRSELAAFLDPILARPDLRIVLTGAGTSAFAGEVAAPALARATGRRVEAVPTTDIVSNPRETFASDVPTLIVSFARSGNSPESVAATRLADQLLGEAYHLVLTCAPDGELAQNRTGVDGSFVLLMPEGSNDTGFAMTSSFTCMLLACLITLGAGDVDILETLAAAAQDVIDTTRRELNRLVHLDAQRIVYLGSGPLRGLAHEAGLKFLELTAGERVAFFESSLGFRHGPKAVIDDTTLAFVFVSSDPAVRPYDVDIVHELRGSLPAERVVALAATPVGIDGALVWGGLRGVGDAFAAAVHMVFAQLFAAHTSAALGKTVDNPFPCGSVNRVVQGVTIHRLGD